VLATTCVRQHQTLTRPTHNGKAMRMASAQSRDWRNSVDDVRAAYDEAPYDQYAHPQSAPGQLAAIAWAFGLNPPEVADARVLEIGCAAAGNLIRLRRRIHARARWGSSCRRPIWTWAAGGFGRWAGKRRVAAR
jgi:hypothetical protein